jgi:hypothetical protein
MTRQRGAPASSKLRFGNRFGKKLCKTACNQCDHVMGSLCEYAHGGAPSTMFWSDDPAEELIGMLLPSSTYPVRRGMRVLIYRVLTE